MIEKRRGIAENTSQNIITATIVGLGLDLPSHSALAGV